MARTIEAIEADSEQLEARFRVCLRDFPAGMPFRNHLYHTACEERHRESCQPAVIARRLALSAEWSAAKRSLSAKAAAARRANDPACKLRRWIFGQLRKAGFQREHTSGQSAYYGRIDSNGRNDRVRVSDHDVPDSPERSYNRANGRCSWAGSSKSLCLYEGRADTLISWRAAARWVVDVTRR